METAALERDRVEKELKLLEVNYHEAKVVWQLVQDLAQVNQNEQQHLAFKEDAVAKRVQFEKAMKADGLLEMIRKTNELTSKLHETEEYLRVVESKLPGVSSSLRETTQKYGDFKHEA
ncbi:MAG: hypothetical protein ACYCX4_17345 [Bacillota bacterium]